MKIVDERGQGPRRLVSEVELGYVFEKDKELWLRGSRTSLGGYSCMRLYDGLLEAMTPAERVVVVNATVTITDG